MYFDENDTQNVPVKTNDVVFGLHAVFACVVTILQCVFYEVIIFLISATIIEIGLLIIARPVNNVILLILLFSKLPERRSKSI